MNPRRLVRVALDEHRYQCLHFILDDEPIGVEQTVENCPLESFVSNCEVLREEGISPRLDLISACNWHEVCQICVRISYARTFTTFTTFTRYRVCMRRCSASSANSVRARPGARCVRLWRRINE